METETTVKKLIILFIYYVKPIKIKFIFDLHIELWINLNSRAFCLSRSMEVKETLILL